MSVFNDSKRVSTAIESILTQSHTNYEFLIMDDCSTDETYKICSEYEKKYDQIKLFRNSKNIGLTKSLNILCKEAQYEYIARQDSDDYSRPERFTQQLNFIKKNNLDICLTRATLNDTQRKRPTLSYLFTPKLVVRFKNPFIHGTLMIKKTTLINLGFYNENYKYAQDYKLFSDAIKKRYKIKTLHKTLYNLNTKNNISSKYKKEQKYYAECVKNEVSP
jgi:glycosyltransferase involved in cell wall biosynthesis